MEMSAPLKFILKMCISDKLTHNVCNQDFSFRNFLLPICQQIGLLPVIYVNLGQAPTRKNQK